MTLSTVKCQTIFSVYNIDDTLNSAHFERPMSRGTGIKMVQPYKFTSNYVITRYNHNKEYINEKIDSVYTHFISNEFQL